MSLLNYIKENYNEYDIFSFDIFDTLCIRPYVKPEDLFQHISEIYNIDNFKNIRNWAFESAVEKYKTNEVEEITITQIYEFIPEELKYIKEKELDLEYRVISPNYEIKKVFDFLCKKNKKIIIISDMYLPELLIEKILHKCGFNDYYKLYLSSTYKKLKATGSLYKIVQSDFNKIEPSKILHIGDNPLSDYNKSISLGFSSYLYSPPIRHVFNSLQENIKPINEKYNDIFSYSVYLGLLSKINSKNNFLKKNDTKKNYWKKFGICYGGPLVYNFLGFIIEYCKENKISDLFLAARDCFLIDKIIKRYKFPINANYVYLTRKISLAATLSLEKKFEHSEFQGVNSLNSVLDLFNKKFGTTFSIHGTDRDIYKWFKEHYNELGGWSKILQKDIVNYIKSLPIKNKDRICFVDTSTQFFSSQELVSTVLPNSKIIGIYLFVNNRFKHRFEDNNVNFINQYSQFLSIPLIELLFTSPEPPIEYLDNNFTPVYKKKINTYEEERLKIVRYIHEGILCFFNEAYNLLKNSKLKFDSDLLYDLMENFIKYPGESDYIQFNNLKFNFDVNHDDYISMFPQWNEMFDYTKDERKTNRYFIEKILKAQKFNKPAFEKYKNSSRNKTIAIIATGETLKILNKIEADIYISCNKAFKIKKDIQFDYLFATSLISIKDIYNDFINYRKGECVKYIPDTDFNLDDNEILLTNYYHRYITADYSKLKKDEFQFDIGRMPVSYNKAIGLQALQFALYTNPQKILLVGFDCTFGTNNCINKYDQEQITFAKAIKEFSKKYYPLTEIISINPVGLIDIF